MFNGDISQDKILVKILYANIISDTYHLTFNAVWRAKKAKQEEFGKELESGKGKRSIFKVAKQMVKEGQDVTGTCCMKDTDGNIRVDSNGVKKIYQEYMERLLNVENEWDKQVECEPTQGPSCRIEFLCTKARETR